MTDTVIQTGDFTASFQIEDRPIRGRAVRMGAASLTPILARHDYPPNLARILGEAVSLAALIGASLKFDGRILVQAEGDGPVRMLVGEYTTGGGVRGYARYDEEAWAYLERLNKGGPPHMPQLFGPSGRLGLILIQDNPNLQPYQGIVPLNKGTLAQCAEDYYLMSEQVPSRIRLAVEQTNDGGWVAGGMMVQRIAGDEKRGDTNEAWREAEALFGTLTPTELADPNLPMPDLLFRLFHEQGVRMEEGRAVTDHCTCNEERLLHTLRAMPEESLRDLVEPDGTLAIDCQFCARHYVLPIERVAGPAH
ncbi:Hsp33 family molecular chaperone HslO [Hyphomonas sp. WL0036]|uniref:Hsp33 family molecular chaperone HslO n=1 Tax=Hyphomonas sediminis TaxID=2866160 RepID=UPI001C7EBA3C|nr:Hsp33 family molecular chaperone HslO [Hyphomonas sediminis]MBY9065429.1 Hsp33 family molecular chaperone HslO [Hyphomonas sediminis]